MWTKHINEVQLLDISSSLAKENVVISLKTAIPYHTCVKSDLIKYFAIEKIDSSKIIMNLFTQIITQKTIPFVVDLTITR